MNAKDLFGSCEVLMMAGSNASQAHKSSIRENVEGPLNGWQEEKYCHRFTPRLDWMSAVYAAE